MKAALDKYAFHPARIYGGGKKSELTDPYRMASVTDGGGGGKEPPLYEGEPETEEGDN